MDTANCPWLTLGQSDPPYTLSVNSLKHSMEQSSSRILTVKPLHTDQDLNGLRDSLFDVWKLNGRGSAKVMANNTVRFQFQEQHHLSYVFAEAPWSYRGWLVAMDVWGDRTTPHYLSRIPIWVKISNIPDCFQNVLVLMEIGRLIGEPFDVRFTGFDNPGTGEAWVRIYIGVSHFLKFALPVNFLLEGDPTILCLHYDHLVNFCQLCGSISHAASACGSLINHFWPLSPAVKVENLTLFSNPNNEISEDNSSKRKRGSYATYLSDTLVCSQLDFSERHRKKETGSDVNESSGQSPTLLASPFEQSDSPLSPNAGRDSYDSSRPMQKCKPWTIPQLRDL